MRAEVFSKKIWDIRHHSFLIIQSTQKLDKKM